MISEGTGIGLDDGSDWPDANESIPFIAESELFERIASLHIASVPYMPAASSPSPPLAPYIPKPVFAEHFPKHDFNIASGAESSIASSRETAGLPKISMQRFPLRAPLVTTTTSGVKSATDLIADISCDHRRISMTINVRHVMVIS